MIENNLGKVYRVERCVTTSSLSYDTEGAAFGVPDVQVSPPPPLINAGGSGVSMPLRRASVVHPYFLFINSQ